MAPTYAILIVAALIVIVPFAGSTTWYVDKTVSSSGNGQSWATAWKDTTNINWASVQPGDTIYLSGGSSGLTYSAFTTSKSGSAGNPITIKRSTESGRDGTITIATPSVISGSNVILDGASWHGIVFSLTGGVIDEASVLLSGSNIILRNAFFNGNYAGSAGHSLGIELPATGTTRIEYCDFYQSVYEDQVRLAAEAPGGDVIFDHNVFRDNNKPVPESPTPHRDVCNPWTGSGGWGLTLSDNIFFNTPGHSSVQPQGDEFLLQVGFNGPATPMKKVYAYNNVVYNTARFIAFGSLNSGVTDFKVYHNTVRNVINGDDIGITCQSPAPYPTRANNIGIDTSNPGFVNAANPLGADGIPFTADDGFNIISGSSAIDAGGNVGITTDILGNVRIGNPDLGAYEYYVSGPITGACGSAQRAYIQAELFPGNYTLCAAGTPPGTTPTLGAPAGSTASWTCAGQNGGNSASCNATRSSKLNGACGPATTTYSESDPWPAGAYCSAGNASPSSPANPAVDSSTTWSCVGSGGGTTASCTASRTSAMPVTPDTPLTFSVASAGTYKLVGSVYAPSISANSFYVDIDSNPAGDNARAWDIDVNSGFQDREVSWRGANSASCSDTPSCAQFNPKNWTLSAGMHTLYVSSRESDTEIQSIRLVKLESNFHPADTDKNWALETPEVSTYNLCWKTPTCIPSPATTYVSNANLMWKSRADGAYHYAGGTCPLCWVSGT